MIPLLTEPEDEKIIKQLARSCADAIIEEKKEHWATAEAPGNMKNAVIEGEDMEVTLIDFFEDTFELRANISVYGTDNQKRSFSWGPSFVATGSKQDGNWQIDSLRYVNGEDISQYIQ